MAAVIHDTSKEASRKRQRRGRRPRDNYNRRPGSSSWEVRRLERLRCEADDVLRQAQAETEAASARLQWALEVEAAASAERAQAVAYHSEVVRIVGYLQERGLLASPAQTPAAVLPPWRTHSGTKAGVVPVAPEEEDDGPDYDPFTTLPAAATA
jgi:hypothetical protein